jgi:hypothetical protein
MTAILKVDTIQDTAGNNIINESSNTITIGKSGDAVNLALGATNNLGITMADQWVLTTDFSGDASPISSNLARYTADSSGYFGTGMTESSGVFTFPQTGNYLIKFKSNFTLTGADAQAQQAVIRITTNNSTFSNASASVQTQFRWGSTSPSYYNNSADYIFNVTNVSTHKCSFEIDVSDNNTVTRGNSNQLETSMQFIRLGDT